MGTALRSVPVRRPVDEVAKVATDPEVVLPIIGGFGRFEQIARHPDGSEEWDLFTNVGTIHVGGRVLVAPPRQHILLWRSYRGTHHSGCIQVGPGRDGAVVTMSVTVEFAGMLTGRLTFLLARGILGRRIEAGLQQLRHHIEYACPGR